MKWEEHSFGLLMTWAVAITGIMYLVWKSQAYADVLIPLLLIFGPLMAVVGTVAVSFIFSLAAKEPCRTIYVFGILAFMQLISGLITLLILEIVISPG